MAIALTTIGGMILLPDGSAPGSGSTIEAKLSQAAATLDGAESEIVTDRAYCTLDADGGIPSTFQLTPTDALDVTGLYYTFTIRAKDARGSVRNTVFKAYVPSTPDPIDIGALERIDVVAGTAVGFRLATATVPGMLQLAGDFGGTAADPRIADGKVAPSKLGGAVDGRVPSKAAGSDAWAWVSSATSTGLPISVKDAPYGAAGDGITDDTAALQAAIAAADAFTPRVVSIYLPSGTYLYTALTNPLGHAFIGPGRLVIAVTGGQQQTTSYADPGAYVFGREYLSSFHKKLIGTSPASAYKVVFSGDSTTDGNGSTTPYRIWEIVPAIAAHSGAPWVSGVNRGQSGAHTGQWVTTYLAGDLAEGPSALVLRWGINDPYYDRTLDDFAASLRSGLATIRASYTLAQMSVVLCTPNSTSDTPNDRDERWYEQVAPIVRRAARDYQCVFVDVYAYLRDARNAADWMDDPYADGRHIHPLNVMNVWIASLLADALFPRGLVAVNGSTQNVSARVATPLSTALPSAYAYGVGIWRAYQSAWPADGAVMTVRHRDGVTLQVNWSYSSSVNTIFLRQSMTTDTAWTPWVQMPAQAVAQANSTATDVAGIVADFNALLAKLRTAGVMAT